MKYIRKCLVTISFLLLLVAFFPFTASAQSEGRSVTPPVFPKCETKLQNGNGDFSHIGLGTKDVANRGFVEGSHDIYSIGSGSFLQCACPKDSALGIESDFWGIDGLPLGQVDLDVYKRAGWTQEETGVSYGIGNRPFLIYQREFSCDIPRPTNSRTGTPTTSRISPTLGVGSGGTGKGGEGQEELPETGIPLELFFGLIIVGEIGFILYKKFEIV